MNMSYCRFQNTSNDLSDCINAIEEEEIKDLSQDEYDALMWLIEQAETIVGMKEEIEAGARVEEY